MAIESLNSSAIHLPLEPMRSGSAGALAESFAQARTGETRITDPEPEVAHEIPAAAGADQVESAVDKSADVDRVEQLTRAIEHLNGIMGDGQRKLNFELDQEAGRLVVRVLDAETGDLVRQIPSEETLQFAQHVEGLVGLIFNDRA